MLRLDRMLVTLGKGSRSEMQKAIRGGRVRVNGNVQRDPSAQMAEDAEILLNGEKLDMRGVLAAFSSAFVDKDFLYKLVEHGVCQSVKILVLINQGYKFLR